MASKNKLYIVSMYRFGDKSLHSYVLGAFTHNVRANNEADREEESRGGKYVAEIVEVTPDTVAHNNGAKVIREAKIKDW
jgi:hypothetical protein